MKRTLTILTAALFASAIAVPVFAQGDSSASPAAEASPSAEKPAKHHHHHGRKKKSEGSTEAPTAAPSDSTTK